MNLPHAKLRTRFVEMLGCAPRSPNKTWMINQMAEFAKRHPTGTSDPTTNGSPEGATATALTPAPPATNPMLEDAAEDDDDAEAVMPGATEPTSPTPDEQDATEGGAPAAPAEAAAASEIASPEETDDDATPPASERAPAALAELVPSSDEGTDEVGDAGPVTQPAPSAEESAATPPVPPAAASGSPVIPLDRANHEEEQQGPVGGVQPAPATKERGRYRGMTVEELRRAYELVLGRPSGSFDADYLRWKIVQAEKGRIRVGPIEPGRRREGPLAEAEKTLPLTLSAAAVMALDTAWANKGFRSRMAFLRTAIREALLKRDEADAAAHFPERTAV